MIPPLVLGLLKSKTLWYAVGMLAVVSVIFVGGCNYGASGKKAIQAEFDAYKKEQTALIVQIQQTNAKDAVKANERLKAEERAIEENYRKQTKELAGLRKELDAVKLDRKLVELFNSNTSTNEQSESSPGPNQQENGILDENPDSDPGIATLGDLIEVSFENNKNHLACIAQVKEWQSFYLNLYQTFEPSQ